MKILALESSATASSVALCEDETLLAESFQNTGLTHSKTLLPMVSNLLATCEISLDDVDVIAVAVGPGSFTGLRIGMSTAMGLAFSKDKLCAPCSTLQSMAHQLSHLEGHTILAVMDARRNQVYHSRFLVQEGALVRLCPDKAISLLELEEEIADIKGPKILVGDGTELASKTLTNVILPPPHLTFQRAYGVAQVARGMAQEGKLVPPHALEPMYHRLSQAERERLEKMKTPQNL